jgi:hypothetical protein
MKRSETSPTGAPEARSGSVAPAEIRHRFRLIVLAVLGTPALAAVGWMTAWQVATTLPGVPNWDGTFTWAPLILVSLGPALLLLAALASPAWVRPRDPNALRTARLLVLIGAQALVVFLFGACAEWWATGGFPPTWQIITLELLASALTLVPSVLLLWRRDDGSGRGWRALAMVAPALLIVLVIAVGSAIHGVPPYDPYAGTTPVAQGPAAGVLGRS